MNEDPASVVGGHFPRRKSKMAVDCRSIASDLFYENLF